MKVMKNNPPWGGKNHVNLINRELCTTLILANFGHCEEQSDVALLWIINSFEIASFRSQ